MGELIGEQETPPLEGTLLVLAVLQNIENGDLNQAKDIIETAAPFVSKELNPYYYFFLRGTLNICENEGKSRKLLIMALMDLDAALYVSVQYDPMKEELMNLRECIAAELGKLDC